jgi:hypothetical protein
MVKRNNAGKLLLFPSPDPITGIPAENWSRRILEIKDNLVSAIEVLRTAYNEMLAGKPVKPADEILAQVEAIVRNDAKIPAYTVVAAIRIHRSISPEPKRKVPLLSRCLKRCLAAACKKQGDTIETRSIEGTSPGRPVDNQRLVPTKHG